MGKDLEILAGPHRFGRRSFLIAVGSSSAVLVAERSWVGRSIARASLAADGDLLHVTLVRPEDQLLLRFEFEGLVHDVAGDQLVADGLGGTPLVRVVLPRQHTSEAPIASGATPSGAASAPIDHRTAGPSRLVFEVTPPIALDVPTLLDLARFQLLTTDVAGDPSDAITMIELPADLRWSPASGVVATAEIEPLLVDRVAHLHRIVVGEAGVLDFFPLHNAATNDGFAGRLPSAAQRQDIVDATTAEGPATAFGVRLTPHGAWAEIQGSWSTIDWIQRVQGGRDQFVQVVARGRLMPFGHPAVWTQTSTRRWIADSDGDLVATMVTEEHFSVIGEGAVGVPGSYAPPEVARSMPFVSVSAASVDDLAAQKGVIDDGAVQVDTAQAWRVVRRDAGYLTGADYRVSYTANDLAGNPDVGFTLPAIFVVESAFADPTLRSRLVGFYASDAGAAFRLASPRAEIAWTWPSSPDSRLTTLYTRSLDIVLEELVGVPLPDLEAVGELPLVPKVVGGVVSHPDLPTGDSATTAPEVEVVYSPQYLASGNDPIANPSAAFLDLVVPTSFPLGGEARGVMTPEMVVEEFNQSLGVGPKLDTSGGGGTWTPADAFGQAAELLRGVKLAQLVAPVLFDVAVAGVDIPGFEIERFADRIETRYTWCPSSIDSVPAAGFLASAGTELCIEIESIVSLDGGVAADASVEFRVSDFTLVVPPVIGLVEIDVRELRAVQPSSGATDLTFDILGWRLGGLLAWVEPLISLLSPAGSDFDVAIDGTDLFADLDLALPDLSLGVLTIENFSIGLSARFPFQGDGTPRIGIGVGSAAEPVGLQILQFGGGFSLELEFSPQGLELLRIHFEVSAQLVSIDIVVAEAYCEVGVAVTFSIESGNVVFVGEIWVEASFSVAGIIGATVRISGRVRYSELEEKVTISGTIHWSVTAVATFSGSVPIGKIDFPLGGGASGAAAGFALAGPAAGAGAPPTSGSFGDVHTFATWNEYVASFAAEA